MGGIAYSTGLRGLLRIYQLAYRSTKKSKQSTSKHGPQFLLPQDDAARWDKEQ